jgi:hypothetical protein
MSLSFQYSFHHILPGEIRPKSLKNIMMFFGCPNATVTQKHYLTEAFNGLASCWNDPSLATVNESAR